MEKDVETNKLEKKLLGDSFYDCNYCSEENHLGKIVC